MTGQRRESYLGNVFDNYQNMMQIARCIREAARQRASARPRILELSRYATNLHEYLPEGEIVRHVTHDEREQPILPMPVAIPFADCSFDICFVTDAYEHIPQELRPSLLAEMLRVTDGLVLLGSPVRSELVTRVDRLIFDFIWGKYAHEFEPLAQHFRYGLEPLDQIVATLRAQGASRVVALPDNFVYRLIHQILIFFDTQWLSAEAGEIYQAVNRIYNERLGAYDYREPCYRYLMVVATSPQINLDELEARMKGPCETPATLAEAEGALIEAFHAADSRLADALRMREQEAAQLYIQMQSQATEQVQLHVELQRRVAESGRLQGELQHRVVESERLQGELQHWIIESERLQGELRQQETENTQLRAGLQRREAENLQLAADLEQSVEAAARLHQHFENELERFKARAWWWPLLWLYRRSRALLKDAY
jgi:hypothetical protein